MEKSIILGFHYEGCRRLSSLLAEKEGYKPINCNTLVEILEYIQNNDFLGCIMDINLEYKGEEIIEPGQKVYKKIVEKYGEYNAKKMLVGVSANPYCSELATKCNIPSKTKDELFSTMKKFLSQLPSPEELQNFKK